MVRKKSNKTPKIKGRTKSSKVIITNQKEYDKKIDWAIEYKKGTDWNQRADAIYRYMACKRCGQMQQVDSTTTACTCWSCVQEMVEPPKETRSRVTTGRPFGWHFMKQFVDKDGKVYHKGVEQPKLKGTLKPTVVSQKVSKPRLKKREKEKIMRDAGVKVHKLKKELSTTRFKKDKKVIMKDIKYYSRIVAGKIPNGYFEKNT